MKKILIMCLIAVLCFSMVLTGCVKEGASKNTNGTQSEQITSSSGEESLVTPKGELPVVKEKMDLTVMMGSDPNIEDMNTNEFTKYLEEKTNVHLNFALTPAKDMSQKLNLVLATQSDLPDVIIANDSIIDNSMLVKYGSQGVFLKLNDLIDKYGHYFFRFQENYPDVLKQIADPDGNIYSLPRVVESYHVQWIAKMWINKWFLDNLGLPEPATTDQFYEVLKAFKNNDPNKNSKPDEVPLIGATTGNHTAPHIFLMNAFIYNDNKGSVLLDKGKVDVAFNKPEYKEGLKYINKLCMEGLLDPVSYTQDAAQMKQMGESGDVSTVGAAAGTNIQLLITPTNERRKEYVGLAPLKGPNGVQLATYSPNSPQTGYFVITNACKYPEVAYRWADFLYELETCERAQWGVKDVDYFVEADGRISRPNAGNWGTVGNKTWRVAHPTLQTRALLDREIKEDDPWTNVSMCNRAADKYKGFQPDEVLPKLFMTDAETEEYNELATTVNEYVKESTARFIVGDMDINAEWDNYINELNKIGIDKYLKLIQNAYDRQYK